MWSALRPDTLTVLNDPKVRKVLGRYLDIFQGKRTAKFLIAKKVAADYKENDSSDKLWSLHEDLTRQYYALEKEVDCRQKILKEMENPEKSYLDLKICLANRILRSCHFCVRACGIDRMSGECGWCKAKEEFSVSTIFQHMGEEPELVPSGTIFTIGCNLRCLHCQNWTISQSYDSGKIYTPKTMAEVIERLRSIGARNVNMVGGEPTPWLHQWLKAFNQVKNSIATVWNSNSYYGDETARLLAGFIDVYLLDFKYGNNACAERISSAPRYWETCVQNHLYAKEHGELIIRVLILPGHNECCTRPILEWVAKNLGTDVRVNLMDQYRPEWRAHEIQELLRRLTRQEFDEALQIAKDVGLTNFIT